MRYLPPVQPPAASGSTAAVPSKANFSRPGFFPAAASAATGAASGALLSAVFASTVLASAAGQSTVFRWGALAAATASRDMAGSGSAILLLGGSKILDRTVRSIHISDVP